MNMNVLTENYKYECKEIDYEYIGGMTMGEMMEAYFKWLNLSRSSIYKSVIFRVDKKI